MNERQDKTKRIQNKNGKNQSIKENQTKRKKIRE